MQIVYASGKPKSTVRGTLLRLKIVPVVEERPGVVRLLKHIRAVPAAAPPVACIRVRAAIKLLTALYANPSITQYLRRWLMGGAQKKAARQRGSSHTPGAAMSNAC